MDLTNRFSVSQDWVLSPTFSRGMSFYLPALQRTYKIVVKGCIKYCVLENITKRIFMT